MRITYEFEDTTDDVDEVKHLVRWRDYYCKIDDIYNRIRNLLKYEDVISNQNVDEMGEDGLPQEPTIALEAKNKRLVAFLREIQKDCLIED